MNRAGLVPRSPGRGEGPGRGEKRRSQIPQEKRREEEKPDSTGEEGPGRRQSLGEEGPEVRVRILRERRTETETKN